jgi:hypothetical protein
MDKKNRAKAHTKHTLVTVTEGCMEQGHWVRALWHAATKGEIGYSTDQGPADQDWFPQSPDSRTDFPSPGPDPGQSPDSRTLDTPQM